VPPPSIESFSLNVIWSKTACTFSSTGAFEPTHGQLVEVEDVEEAEGVSDAKALDGVEAVLAPEGEVAPVAPLETTARAVKMTATASIAATVQPNRRRR
jgi:hypothetical protein